MREAWVAALVTGFGVAWCAAWPERVAEYPGAGQADSRVRQLAMGEDLRSRKVTHVVLTPCAYEQFAVIAAFEAPERVTIEGRRAGAVTSGCPEVQER